MYRGLPAPLTGKKKEIRLYEGDIINVFRSSLRQTNGGYGKIIIEERKLKLLFRKFLKFRRAIFIVALTSIISDLEQFSGY